MLRSVSKILVVGLCALSGPQCTESLAKTSEGLFSKENLYAWCIVPFDAKHRTPAERAKMLTALGIRKFAYDWRKEHIPTFDDEIAAMRHHGIEVTAFWLWLKTLEPGAEEDIALVFETLKRNQLKTQIWISFDDRNLESLVQPAKVEAVTAAIHPIAQQAEAMDCQVGLYNHGGWFGNPDNQIEIIKSLNRPNVGLVYNFHHAHHQIDRFTSLMRKMKPYLLAININGMTRDGPKILPIGSGESELQMLRVIQESGYSGQIGILDHRENVDAKISLSENIAGLEKLRSKLSSRSKISW